MIAEDVASGAVATGAPGIEAIDGEVDYDGWRRIDMRERLGAEPGRERAKLSTREELLQTARDYSVPLPEIAKITTSASLATRHVTILFGTESGGAELVAAHLERSLTGSDVMVADLADVDPMELERGRLHVLVCSTYGDGEVPTAARRFHAKLLAGGVGLTGLQYAVFGMGDRSYTKTYSRGSELVDEALSSVGATRLGEYGRHDAGGPVSATDAAVEWLQGVLAGLPS